MLIYVKSSSHTSSRSRKRYTQSQMKIFWGTSTPSIDCTSLVFETRVSYLFLDLCFSEKPIVVEKYHHFETERETHWPVPNKKKSIIIKKVIFMWPWNENAWTKQKQQTNGNRKIWLIYRTLRWKNFMSENFLEINLNQFDVILQHANVFSILGFSLAEKQRGRNLIVSSIGWWNK